MAFGLLSAYSRFFRYVGPNVIIRKISDTEIAILNVPTDYREAHVDQETEARAAEPVSVPTYTVYGNTLNFSRNDYITGINIIGESDKKLLFWTDNRIVYREDGTIERTNEPRKINIEKFKAADHVRVRGNSRYAETNFPRMATYDPKFLEEEISVIKPHPRGAQNIEGDNENREFSLNFDWVDITDYDYEACQDDAPADTCKSGFQYRIDGEEDGAYCNPDTDGVTNCYRVITKDGEEDFNASNRIFQDAFPRFTYRWRYDDGEYSPIGPFTNAAFVPAAQSVNEIQRYSEGENNRMTNAVLGLTISNIPRGGTDVVAIDIIYKESITNTLYSIETIDVPENLRGFGYETLNINKRSFYRSLPANQLFRAFDEVPRAAKSQEISGNRIIYGNYLKNFEQPKEVNMTVVTLDRSNLTREGEDFVSNRQDQRSIKSDREYEFGIVFIDKYGRQGGLLTGSQARYRTPFNFDSPQQFACVLSDDAPEWARYYRYYIKDVSAEHFNVFAHGVWRDPLEPEFTWLQISSNDRNKIIEDGALYVKGYWSDLSANPNEHIHERTGSFQDIRTKYKREILDIQNDVPAVIRTKLDDAWNTNPLFNGPSNTARAVVYETCTGTEDCVDGIKVDSMFRRVPADYDADTNPYWKGGTWDNVGYLPNDLGYYPDFRGNYPDDNGRYPVYLPDSDTPSYADDGGEYRFNNLGNFADGSFFVKVPTGPVSPITGEDSNLDRGDTELFEGWFGGDQAGTRDYSYWFETEPQTDDSLLDLYYESGETFTVEDDLKRINRLDWSNCVRMLGGDRGNIEERKLSGLFNSTEYGNSVRANIPQENYELDRVFNGLIFSGLYNDGSGINRLNQFVITDGITKELEPNYGSIQKLHTRDTNLVVFLEDKVFRVLSDKDALYNADGNSNVTSTAMVLGQATPYNGEYGISKNPESFCTYGQNIWFSDKNRGVILQLTPSNGQIFEISSTGMNDFFRDRLKSSERILMGFDDYQDQIVCSVQGYNVEDVIESDADQVPNDNGSQTVVYEHTNQGWVSRRSYIPDGALSLNNRFYSFSDGKIWVHNQGVLNEVTLTTEHHWYDQPYTATITGIFNDLPSSVKEFKTLNYEGSTGWILSDIQMGTGDDNVNQNLDIFPFVNREGKFFTPIVTTEDRYEPTPIPVFGTQNIFTLSDCEVDADVQYAYTRLLIEPPVDLVGYDRVWILNFASAGEIVRARVNLTWEANPGEDDSFPIEDFPFRALIDSYTILEETGRTWEELPGNNFQLRAIDAISTDKSNADAQVYKIVGSEQRSGVRGFWVKVTLSAIGNEEDPQTVPLKELFSIGSEVFISTK